MDNASNAHIRYLACGRVISNFPEVLSSFSVGEQLVSGEWLVVRRRAVRQEGSKCICYTKREGGTLKTLAEARLFQEWKEWFDKNDPFLAEDIVISIGGKVRTLEI